MLEHYELDPDFFRGTSVYPRGTCLYACMSDTHRPQDRHTQTEGAEVHIVEKLMRIGDEAALHLLTRKLETAPSDVLKRILSSYFVAGFQVWEAKLDKKSSPNR